MEYPGFEGLVRYGETLGVAQILTTNGDRLLQAIPSWITLFEYIKLSFYGGQTLHDQYMGREHYRSQFMLARSLEREHRMVVGVNYMVTPHSMKAVSEFLQDCESAGIDNIMFQTYISNGRQAVDEKLRLANPRSTIQDLRDLCSPYAGKFKGGMKLQDYSKKNWFMVLTPEAILTLPASDGTSDFEMGSIFSDELAMPDGTRLSAAAALEGIWNTRFETDAIVLYDEGVARNFHIENVISGNR